MKRPSFALFSLVCSLVVVGAFACSAQDDGPPAPRGEQLKAGDLVEGTDGKTYQVQADGSLAEYDPVTGMLVTDSMGNPITKDPDDVLPSDSTPGGNPGGELIGGDDDGPVFAPGCGNGQIDDEEICDDGNMIAGTGPDTWDGCGDCRSIDPGFICGTPGMPCTYTSYCGDARVVPPETCDDFNEEAGDGCTNCAIEAGWECPTPGQPCIYTVMCGDGVLGGAEVCDDGNTEDGDGCAANCLGIEMGWTCSTAGQRCVPTCGDGVPVGRESCDDGNVAPNDGCSEACQIEPVFLDPNTNSMVGWSCPTPGAPCVPSVCGDGMVQGEPCDDGNNNDMGDGCSPGCRLEPDCSAADGSCISQCGDGLILAGDNEECDDGNTRSGDGCSSTCTVEPGFMCDTIDDGAGATLALPIVYRDFYGMGWNDTEAPVPYNANGHPDFENELFSRNTPKVEVTSSEGLVFTDVAGPTRGLVNTQLGANQTGSMAFKPVFAASGTPAQITSAMSFHQWYVDTPGVNASVADTLVLTAGQTAGTFAYDTDEFYPIDGRLLATATTAPGPEPMRPVDWLAQGCGQRLPDGQWEDISSTAKHNYSFTSEVRYWFEFSGGEQLTFRGDDDVWVFIKRRLVVDLGGNHEPYGGDICGNIWSGVETAPACAGLAPTTADRGGAPLNLEVGKVYEAVVFQAERHTCQSNYRLTLANFARRHSNCYSKCGDGVVAGDEQCDEGAMNGTGYGHCTAECTPGPRCGDGKIDVIDPATGLQEQCDNGVNLDVYYLAAGDCAPGCVNPGYCGDGVVQPEFGERCDLGTELNDDNAYDGCKVNCDLGPRCGDGTTQLDQGEECDDGNRRNGDGCSGICTQERDPGAR